MLEKIKEELTYIKENPIRIIFAVAIMVFMAALTAFAWDGVTKRLVICVGLTALSGILLLIPGMSNWVSIPLLMIYLYYVPIKIFQRMELPMHDMSRIMDGVAQLTVAFIICTYLLVFLFTQSSAAALGAGSGFFLILFLVEYYIWRFRGDFLMPNDLGAAGTAISVMGNYNYGLSPEALYTVIYFLFFIVLGSRIRIRMNKWVHIGVSVLALLAVGGWYYTVMDTPNPLGKEFVINYWNMGDTRNLNGACLSYFLLLKDSKVDVPSGYSEKALEVIAQAAEAGELYDVQTYLNLIKISDDAFKELVMYFEQVKEPVIICVFGDHQPALGENFYKAAFTDRELSEQELNLQKYIVPYVVWANYDADLKEYGRMSANYLPAALMECAGLQLPPFYQYLMEMHEEYPVLTKRGCLDRDGRLVDIADIWDEEIISQYRMLQYNQLYARDYIHEIFEGSGTNFVDTAIKNGYENVLSRVIVQIYYKEMYDEVMKVYPFENLIWTLYYIGYPGGSEIIEFMEQKQISVLAIDTAWWDEQKQKDFENSGIKVYVHTVDDEEEALRRLEQGISGIYSDDILPAVVRQWKEELFAAAIAGSEGIFSIFIGRHRRV